MTTQYAVKYQLANHHTGRLHNSLKSAIKDLAKCQRAARAGLGDQQGISIVLVEDGAMRHMTEDEMDTFATTAFEMGVEC